MGKTTPHSVSNIEQTIQMIRGQRVMLDADLAKIYGVTVKRLNEQVKRNRNRFPEDFMFQLTKQEVIDLKSQNATSSSGWGGRRTRPYAFTEHGAIMLANVLQSKVAVKASIHVVRAFVHLREMAVGHADLLRKITAMEKKYDSQFKVVFDAIRQLMFPTGQGGRPIGFQSGKKGE